MENYTQITKQELEEKYNLGILLMIEFKLEKWGDLELSKELIDKCKEKNIYGKQLFKFK